MKNLQKFYQSEYLKSSSFQRIFGSDHAYLKSEQTWNKKFQTELLKFLKTKQIIDSINIDLRQLHNLIDS